ncbi:hypothetical protein BGZ54_005571 [Gamsiella multidivaricata]|nr:hypothetical protein BGZ54_005571 [Gamsiella multidivaricata]
MVRKSSRKSANKQKGYPAKSHKHRVQAKNQRAGFKSTEERKLAQLIPALDENGMIIENHFISPRDTDGDGTPDSYVLLRPAADSEYMMDIGLFDDEIVAPVPAALSSEFTARDPAATIITTAASAMEVPVETAICEDAGAGPNTSSPLLSAAPSMLAA